MRHAVAIDSLVRGPVGTTDRVETMRVTFCSPFGWVAGVNEDGRQRVMGEAGPYQFLEAPRPLAARVGIPEHLR